MPSATINVRIGDTSTINASATPDATINVAIGAPGPPGPSGSGGGGGGSSTFAAENTGAVNFAIGMPVAVKLSPAGVERASAANGSKPCVGLASLGSIVGVSEDVQFAGTITKANWTAITGSASLSPNSDYYLSATPGMLTNSPPSTTGQVVQQVGRAITANTLLIEIDVPILL